MAYIDGFVAPVYAGRGDDYKTLAETASKLFIEHGALHVVESIGAAEVPEGKMTDLWRAVAADKTAGEQIAFSWIVWPSKAARDKGWEACMADERMKGPDDMPFDTKRMIFGGFEQIVDTKAA